MTWDRLCLPTWRCLRWDCQRCNAQRKRDAEHADQARQLEDALRNRPPLRPPDDPTLN